MKNIIFILVLFSAQISFTQSLDDTIVNLATEAGYSYILPVTTAFGSNLNSGWVYEVPPTGSSRFFMRLSLVAMGSFFNNESLEFDVWANYRLTTDVVDKILLNSGITIENPLYFKYKAILTAVPQIVNLSGPTVIGSSEKFLNVFYPGSEIEGMRIESYQYEVKQVKGYLDEKSFFPSAAVQFTLGTFCGTNFTFRYLPPVKINKVGTITFWGVGIINNPQNWINITDQVDFGVGFFHQKMFIGDLFNSSATQIGIYLGKKYGDFYTVAPSIGFNYELSKTIISYTYYYEDQVYGVPVTVTRPIDIEFTGKNKFTFTAGVAAGAGIFGLKLSYKFAPTSTVTAIFAFNVL